MKLEDYYLYYLTLHKNKKNRLCHALGQIATICFILIILFKYNFIFLIFSPVIIYPFVWFGHTVFEKNKPAAFSNPVYAKICDWIMLKDMIFNKLDKH